jgi:pantoate--beta-alanine ligase
MGFNFIGHLLPRRIARLQEETAIETITTVKQMRERSRMLRQNGQTIAFVPTMGFLHEGHLSLMRLAYQSADHVVVSIFVNPTQFGPGEDFAAYPRDLERDADLARREKVDSLYLPTAGEIYPAGFQTYVRLEALSSRLCGQSRPGHFAGVATVVTKLFNIVEPQAAIFGQKDFQQWVIIQQLVRDLNMDIKVIGAPTVREADGLAMSSRNTYLSAEQRQKALCLSEALKSARQMVASGICDAKSLRRSALGIISRHSDVSIDYIALCHPQTLEEVTTISGPTLMALAVKVGKTRLIDNVLLNPSDK